jgi:hypothetical protein
MIVATVRSIVNGFIIEANGEEHYVADFNVNRITGSQVNHEHALRQLVKTFPSGSGKIPPIKAVRQYCSDNNFNKYYGLKDAKDFVESCATDEYWRGYPLD